MGAASLIWGASPAGWVPIQVDANGVVQVFDPAAAGLHYRGTVGDVPGANQFTINALAGLGAGKFSDATAPYRAFVMRDAGGAGAPPQGEMRTITAYDTATGTFTTAAFTVPVAVGDEILILHPRLAEVLDILLLQNVPAADAITNLQMRDIIGNKTDTGQQTAVATASEMRYLKGLIDILADAGITVFPAAVAPGNGVSLAEVIRYISNNVDALYTLQETGGTLLATGAEDNIVIVDAPAGVFNPIKVMIDLTNMAGADSTIIRLYYRIAAAGAYILKDTVTYTGPQDPDLINVELEPNRFGFKVTLQQTAGVMRNYAWEYFFES